MEGRARQHVLADRDDLLADEHARQPDERDTGGAGERTFSRL
jgi:hypothetical protein